MPLPRALVALSVILGLSACVSDGPAQDYAFVGTWDCKSQVFTFTNTTYNDGTKTYPIQAVSKNGSDYTLFFANGYRVGLGLVTATGLTWVSGTTGNQLSCRRVN